MENQPWTRATHLGARLRQGLAPLLLAALLSACGGESDTPPPAGPVCANQATPGTVSVFAANVGSSEGIAFLNGQLYIAGGDGIRTIASDGSAAPLATVPATVGMVAWKGALYVASGTDGTTPSVFCGASNQGVIWKVTTDGHSAVFARGFNSPNFIVVTPWNTLLVSDDCPNNSTIYEVDASGSTSPWTTNIASANGMAFDVAASHLLVATTFVATPPLYTIALNGDHSPGAASKLHSFASGTTPDGIAVDAGGNAYVTLNLPGLIHKVAPDGTDSPFAAGLTKPASLAFGNAPGFDPCSMYVTSLLGHDVYQVTVGTTGRALLQ